MFIPAIPFKGQDNLYHSFYVVVNKINGKLYYGKHTTDNLCDSYLGSGVLIEKAIKKHGSENFKRIDLAFFDDSELAFEFEELVVDQLVVGDQNTYNTVIGGKGRRLGFRHAEEAKMKMTGPKTEEHKQNLSKALKGRKLSEEHKAAMRGPRGPYSAERVAKSINNRKNWFNGHPWNMAMKKTTRPDEVKRVWKSAISAYNLYHEGHSTPNRLARAMGDLGEGNLYHALTRKFSAGWNPTEDQHWLDWANNIE